MVGLQELGCIEVLNDLKDVHKGDIFLEFEFELSVKGIKQLEVFTHKVRREFQYPEISNCFVVFNRDEQLHVRTLYGMVCGFGRRLHLEELDILFLLQRGAFSSHLSDALLYSGLSTSFARVDELSDKLFNSADDYISNRLRDVVSFIGGFIRDYHVSKTDRPTTRIESFNISKLFDLRVKVTATKEYL